MKERPILFSGPMVRAILDGRKTQTRRMMKHQPPVRSLGFSRSKVVHEFSICGRDHRCPYGKPGDRLWVRETWQALADFGHGHRIATKEDIAAGNASFRYRATDETGWIPPLAWRPSIHMPRWASRITLEIVNVRVERLQDISEGDSEAEGTATWIETRRQLDQVKGVLSETYYRDQFRELWQSINGPESWNANPWVWVVEFRKMEGGSHD